MSKKMSKVEKLRRRNQRLAQRAKREDRHVKFPGRVARPTVFRGNIFLDSNRGGSGSDVLDHPLKGTTTTTTFASFEEYRSRFPMSATHTSEAKKVSKAEVKELRLRSQKDEERYGPLDVLDLSSTVRGGHWESNRRKH